MKFSLSSILCGEVLICMELDLVANEKAVLLLLSKPESKYIDEGHSLLISNLLVFMYF